MSIVNDADAIREALQCLVGTHEMNALGWCTRCGYTPPGRKKIIWTDFETGKPVNGTRGKARHDP
jgi:hypothetical protein